MNDITVDTTIETQETEEVSEDKYKDGEELSFVRVRFPGNSKSQPFLLGKRRFTYGQKVLAMSDRGMTVGYINSFPYAVKYDKSLKSFAMNVITDTFLFCSQSMLVYYTEIMKMIGFAFQASVNPPLETVK